VSKDVVIVGKFGSVHGVHGWLKIVSYTDPKTNILDLTPWLINQNGNWQELVVKTRQVNDKGIIVELPNLTDREIAKSYTNQYIAVKREQLPKLASDDFYWCDLEGLSVFDKEQNFLGKVDCLFATGANDVLVVKNEDKESLIPYLSNVILEVNLGEQFIKVDWNSMLND
jgi:16S rRNA processing protein RimM